ncbi:hypothetical protein SAMN05421827_101216 [Pedobacter terrae]|uniref:Uncharacterized protein n=1 Tax=Pedobacter terrae TaxID=405671 RepID=A0A1G7N5I1_9SPHI|nr:hypothetical protein SAMN05421827_101216 [Pedobacter terrae]
MIGDAMITKNEMYLTSRFLFNYIYKSLTKLRIDHYSLPLNTLIDAVFH